MSELWTRLQGILLDQSLPTRQRFETIIRDAFEAQVAASDHHAALSAARVHLATESGHQRIGNLIAKGIEVFLRANIVSQEDEYRFLSEFCVQTVFAALGKLADDPTAFDGRRAGRHTALKFDPWGWICRAVPLRVRQSCVPSFRPPSLCLLNFPVRRLPVLTLDWILSPASG